MFDAQYDRYQYRIYMTIGGEVPQDLGEQDAFMITGSPLSVLDQHVFSDDLMAFIRKCDAAKKPLMGACFGHQAIALALGGRVERLNSGYNVGMYVFHEDAVTELPEGCDLLGSTAGCKNASFAKGNHIFTTQAHPEFSKAFMSSVLKFTESSIPEEARKAAWDSLEREDEGHVFGLWTTQFFKDAISAG